MARKFTLMLVQAAKKTTVRCCPVQPKVALKGGKQALVIKQVFVMLDIWGWRTNQCASCINLHILHGLPGNQGMCCHW